MAARSGLSDVSRCGLRKFLDTGGEVHFLSFFLQISSPIEQKLEEREFRFSEL